MAMIAAALAVVGAAAGLALYALSDNIVFFYSPSELAAKNVAMGAACASAASWRPARSSSRRTNSRFLDHRRRQEREGFLPGACRRTCFARARASSPRACSGAPDVIRAETILAKHDERYMPREVVECLKKQGRWQETGGGMAKP